MLDRFQRLLNSLLVDVTLTQLLELGIHRVLSQLGRAHILHVAHDHGWALVGHAIVKTYDATLILSEFNLSVVFHLLLREVASWVSSIVEDARLIPRHLRRLVEAVVRLVFALFAAQLIPLIDHILRLIRRRQIIVEALEDSTGRVMRRHLALPEVCLTAVSKMNKHLVRSSSLHLSRIFADLHLARAM